jgi:hypothetical protein
VVALAEISRGAGQIRDACPDKIRDPKSRVFPYQRRFRLANAYDTFKPEVIPMAAPAPAKERLKERLSLEERIQRRAYELYVQHGNESGSELDDWLQAEEEICRAEEEAINKR